MRGKHSKGYNFKKNNAYEEIPKALKEEYSRKSEEKKNSKKVNILVKILLIFLILFLGLIAGAIFYLKGNIVDIMQHDDDISKDELEIEEQVEEQLSGFKNIVIFGIDSRKDDYGVGNRSDCIILASINNKTGEIKLISVYRDTYVNIKNHGLDKITHAYSYGGPELAVSTLNKNLDLNIEEYITVNFDAVVAAVDALGGVKLDIDSEEVKYINTYIDENIKVTGKKSSHITSAGTYNVDGVQALAYSRIRYTAGGDYKRAERMRIVIDAMFTKLKSKKLGEITSFAKQILPLVKTSITTTDILKLAPSAIKYKIAESEGWPYQTKGITLDRWYGIPVTLESNVIQLHKQVFEQEDYEPSNTVKEISRSIINKTGYK